MRRMATTRVASSLHIKYGAKSQESLTKQEPLIFYGRHDTSQRPQNPRAFDGTDEVGYGRDNKCWQDHSLEKSLTSACATDEDSWTIQCHQ